MRIHARFVGKVQGVGFRATARALAGRHPVSGWVRNEPDGSVTLECQGAREAIDAFLNDLDELVHTLVQHRHTMDVPELAGEQGFVIQR